MDANTKNFDTTFRQSSSQKNQVVNTEEEKL